MQETDVRRTITYMCMDARKELRRRSAVAGLPVRTQDPNLQTGNFSSVSRLNSVPQNQEASERVTPDTSILRNTLTGSLQTVNFDPVPPHTSESTALFSDVSNVNLSQYTSPTETVASSDTSNVISQEESISERSSQERPSLLDNSFAPSSSHTSAFNAGQEIPKCVSVLSEDNEEERGTNSTIDIS